MTERITARESVATNNLDAMDPSDRVELAVKGTAFTNGNCRALNCESDGILNLVMSDDEAVTAYLVHKGYNPIVCKEIAAGATDMVVWALF